MTGMSAVLPALFDPHFPRRLSSMDACGPGASIVFHLAMPSAHYADRSLLQIAAAVRPIRLVAETARAAARAAGDLDDDRDCSAMLSAESLDGDSMMATRTAESVSEIVDAKAVRVCLPRPANDVA
jgi:hypothetical protein